MKILLINYDVPFPVNNGSRMRTWDFIKSMSDEHSLSLLCGAHKSRTYNIEPVKAYFDNIWAVDLDPRPKDQGFREKFINIIKQLPWEITEFYSERVEQEFLRVINNFNFDVIFVNSIMQAQYVIKNRKNIKAKVMLDLPDIETVKLERLMSTEGYKSVYDRFRKGINYWLLSEYHKKLRSIDTVTVCSQCDKDYVIKKRWTKDVRVVPNSVDVAKGGTDVLYTKEQQDRKTILFCGDLSYGPNMYAIEWFLEKVFQKIKQRIDDVKFHIVGCNPSDRIKKHACGENIFLFSDVPDIRPYYENCAISIVPIHSGSGTRLKILEAFAVRRPVVTTTIGAEGLMVVNGKHCLVADNPEEFGNSILSILNDFDLARSLTSEAYEFVKENYNVKATSKLIRDMFKNA